MTFSATEAAFEGFRLVRRNPMALIAWTAIYALVSLAALVALGPMLEQLIDWQAQVDALEAAGTPELSEVWAVLGRFGAIMAQIAWLVPVAMVVEAMMAAAVARGVLKPEAGGGASGYLRLGMDEVRVLVVTFVLGLVYILVMAAALIAVGIVLAAGETAGLGGWNALLAVVGMIAVFCLMVWLAVRLSLAVPITVAERRFAFFDSFRLTKGRFWPLLGMAIIIVVMVLIIELLSTIISMPIGMMSGAGAYSWGAEPSPEALRAATDMGNPWVIAGVVVEGIVKALTVGVLYAPFSAAYRAIAGAPPSDGTA